MPAAEVVPVGWPAANVTLPVIVPPASAKALMLAGVTVTTPVSPLTEETAPPPLTVVNVRVPEPLVVRTWPLVPSAVGYVIPPA